MVHRPATACIYRASRAAAARAAPGLARAHAAGHERAALRLCAPSSAVDAPRRSMSIASRSGAWRRAAAPASRADQIPSCARALHATAVAKAPDFKRAELSVSEYNRVAGVTLDSLQDKLEALIEEACPDGEDWDIEAASGVLNLKLGRHGTYVINKQPPNQQIWLSSPTSGPYRMDFARADADEDGHSTQDGDAVGGLWFSKREGQPPAELWRILRTEIAKIVGEEQAAGLVP